MRFPNRSDNNLIIMEIKETIENPLTLKVMRLSRPTLTAPVIVTCESKDIPGHLFNTSLKNEITSVNGAESLAIGQFLTVPQSFGSIYLGEIFSCYVAIRNDSNDSVSNVTLKIILQTQSQSLPIIDGRIFDAITPKQCLDEIIHHEVKETGVHVLSCEVTYANNLCLRKFFKFQVLKPLDVKTKFYSSKLDESYLEVQIRNISAGPISLETVRMNTASYYKVIQLNAADSVFGKINILDKDASRQYLYHIIPLFDVAANVNNEKDPVDFGYVDIVWRSNLGEKGHLQTSMLQIMRPERSDLRLAVVELPNIVVLEKPFQFSCKISNTTDRELDICIYLEEMKNLVWCGTSGQVKKIPPLQHIEVQLRVIPLNIGLQTISGLRVREFTSPIPVMYKFENLAQVFVMQE